MKAATLTHEVISQSQIRLPSDILANLTIKVNRTDITDRTPTSMIIPDFMLWNGIKMFCHP